MRRNQKGFTFLEMIISILLLTILLGMLWNFFASVYVDYTYFDRKVNLSNQADSTQDFIRNILRTADTVTIIDTSGNSITSTTTSDVIDVDLKEIKCTQRQVGAADQTVYIVLENITSPDIQQGKMQLVYRVGSSTGTYNLISDMVEKIQVSKPANSNYITFDCEYKKKGESNERVIVNQSFSESIAYK